MRRLQITKKRHNILQYYESTTNTRFLRSCVFTALLYIWIMIIYKTFTYTYKINSTNNNILTSSNNTNTNTNTISNKIKPVCCYVSTYYNISYHYNGNQNFITKIQNINKIFKKTNKKTNKKSHKKSYKIHKNTQRDGSTVTIVKYKGKFYIFYDEDYLINKIDLKKNK
jgi:hypothetical protein